MTQQELDGIPKAVNPLCPNIFLDDDIPVNVVDENGIEWSISERLSDGEWVEHDLAVHWVEKKQREGVGKF